VRSRWHPGFLMGATGGLPNMRLKLSGLSLQWKRNGCALTHTNYRSRAQRPAGTLPAA